MKKRLVLFVLGGELDPNKDVWPWGGEPVYRDDRYVGTVTSAGYIHVLYIYDLSIIFNLHQVDA